MKVKNSLQFKAILLISIVFVALITTVTSIEYLNSKNLILDSMEDSGKQTVTIHAKNLSSWLQARLSQVEVIANTQLVRSMNYDEILDYFQMEQENYDGVFNTFGISDKTGKLTLQNNTVIDISTEASFPLVMQGEKVISNPFQDQQADAELIISMECPVKNSETGNVIGLVSGACLVSTVFRDNTDFHLGKTDIVYILSGDGTVLYHSDNTLINSSNFLDDSNKDFTKTAKEALSNESYMGKFKDDNETKMLFTSHVEGTDWYIFLEVPTKEYTSSVNALLLLIVIVSFAAVFVLVVFLIFVLRSFFQRLLKLAHLSGEVAEGYLLSALPESSDELGKINSAFNKMISNLRNIIVKIRNVSDIVIESSNSYKNVSAEVVECRKSMMQSVENITLGAKSTTDEIQNITSSVNDMEKRSIELVDISESIDLLITETKDKTLNGTKNLGKTVKILYEMKDSVEQSSQVIINLSKKSETIANITTTISSISNQTNLLALNASIEAARAGESGKGFTVVAEEIRKLAEQSQKATAEITGEVQQIQQQIADAVKAMKDSIDYVIQGTGSIDQISNIFDGIEEEIKKIDSMSSSVFGVAKVLREENMKINAAVANTSAISQESVASTVCFQEMMNNQEKIFIDLKSASEQLDEISASLSGEISRFVIE
ncbi:methyl-accepting chemotaxis protein [Anaeromicropila populeti]|uniref:Methyl-accepting chemotaxis sensory transducer with Cache sensor n=1 Tax=Anaeromicropila populeti TaxID=37658 RepID=A0A1I6J8Z8_9FIRM|nr:methyl-accepting chemotaxis protein [Anaeromicropila populeti]SFR75453.1 methyl-accepting chemotaxis sensory transducer with Cache sensor [Anaeromicropila populeti]